MRIAMSVTSGEIHDRPLDRPKVTGARDQRGGNDDQRHVIGSVGEYKELAKTIRADDWNDVHIIARGNMMVHILNGHVMCVLVDDDLQHRMFEGKLGMQVHNRFALRRESRESAVCQASSEPAHRDHFI